MLENKNIKYQVVFPSVRDQVPIDEELADSFLLLKRVYFQYPAWAGWGSNLLLLCGPFIFFYAQSVIYKDFHLTKRKLIHFLKKRVER